MSEPLRVLLIAGSGRRQYNCPGVDSKARALMNGGNPRVNRDTGSDEDGGRRS